MNPDAERFDLMRFFVPVLAQERLRPQLLRDDSGGGGTFNLTFRGRSPKFTRFGVLLLVRSSSPMPLAFAG